MKIDVLESEVEKSRAWYAAKGKAYKRYSVLCRLVLWALATAAICSMTVAGANALTGVLAALAGATYGFDRLMGLTRNWAEFSFAEMRLATLSAVIRFQVSNSYPAPEVLSTFKQAMDAVEAETSNWRDDVTQGLEKLKSDLQSVRARDTEVP